MTQFTEMETKFLTKLAAIHGEAFDSEDVDHNGVPQPHLDTFRLTWDGTGECETLWDECPDLDPKKYCAVMANLSKKGAIIVDKYTATATRGRTWKHVDMIAVGIKFDTFNQITGAVA